MAKASKTAAKNAMAELKQQKHTIPKEDAEKMVKKYKQVRKKLNGLNEEQDQKLPAFPISVTYNKDAIDGLINLPGCVGVRIYPAVTKDNALTFVLVGVDAEGENIYGPGTAKNAKQIASSGTVTDEGQMSPPYPAPTNGL